MHNVRAGRALIAMLFLGGRRYDVCMDVCCESGARVGRLVCGTGAAALCAGGPGSSSMWCGSPISVIL